MTSRFRLVRPIALLLGLCLLAGVLVAGITFPAVAGLGLVSNDAGDTVTTVSTDVVDGPLPLTTMVTDVKGAPIARFFEPNQNRQAVTSDKIAPAMKAAIVAIEDRRFYQHNGVDWQGTIRALIANSASGDVVQGASTLTQQYVKNYFLYVTAKTETERLKATEQTSARKLKEAQIALQMERALSKEEILTRYLNIISFGNGAAGVAAAARTYFNTTPDKLTVAQAAVLAGMVRNIAATDPVTKPQAALDRRNLVIQQMREQQMIDDAQAKSALASPLGIANPLVTQPAGCIGAGDAGFFCRYVQSYLLDAGFTTDQLNRGGYTIKTTLDPNVLAKMKASLVQQVPPGQPNVADVMSVVRPAPTSTACSRWRRTGRSGSTAAGWRPATGCLTSRSISARARPTRSSRPPPPWRRGWASTTCSRCRRAATPRPSTSTAAGGRSRCRTRATTPTRCRCRWRSRRRRTPRS